ncbi:hypothetical protein F2P79_016033 [Pimephales promelas]|nr:hypothetical protein F2P79_016033 [Pimephales promelas]
MPQDYSQETAATYGTYKDHSLNCKPVRYFPSTEPYGYQQPYHGIPATSPVYQDERLTPRDTLAHHAHERPAYERHSNSYGQSAPNPVDKSSFLTPRQYADYAQPETYQPYHPVRPPFLPYPHVEPTYRGPIPTIPHFCSEDPREFARLKIALENLLPAEATERFKYQILVDHLKRENALLIADSYVNSRMFALKVPALVGMLDQLGAKGLTELKCGSHVSRLLAKLPHDLKANFRRFVNPIQNPVPTLIELSNWLEYELRIQEDESQYVSNVSRAYSQPQQRNCKPVQRFATVLHGGEQSKPASVTAVKKEKPTKYYPFCNTV